MLTLSPHEADKLVQDFCCDEMWGKNEICRFIDEKYGGKSCVAVNKCPLYLFKLHLTEKAKEGE